MNAKIDIEQSRIDSARAIRSRLARLEAVRERERNAYRLRAGIPLDRPVARTRPRWY